LKKLDRLELIVVVGGIRTRDGVFTIDPEPVMLRQMPGRSTWQLSSTPPDGRTSRD